MTEAPRRPSPSRRIAVATLLVLLSLGAVGYVKYQRDKGLEAYKLATKQLETPDQKSADDFDKALEARQPKFNTIQRQCYVEDHTFNVTTGDSKQDNAFGGVATDLMKIALSPPQQKPGAPSIDRQNFDLLLSTCPVCGATYFDIDFFNIGLGKFPKAKDNLKQHFNLAQLCPELDATKSKDWTYDERGLVRYLTQQTAGYPDYELGYTALSGAYSSNLSVGIGRDYHIPAAAFYALAAAQFKHHIASGKFDNHAEAGLVAMTMGEMYRLLGRHTDAKSAFASARQIGTAPHGSKDGIDPGTRDILTYLEKLNAAGDSSLHRAPLANAKTPPLGWYIDTILPGINAELDVQRSKWAKLDDPDAIVAAIRAQLKAGK